MSHVESSFGHITALNLINGPNEGVALLMKLERALLGGECCERNETHLALSSPSIALHHVACTRATFEICARSLLLDTG